MKNIDTRHTRQPVSKQSQGGRLSISERRRRSTITIQGITIRKITIQKPSTITGPRQPTGWRWCQKVSKNRARGLENGGRCGTTEWGWGTRIGPGGGTWRPRKGHRNSCKGRSLLVASSENFLKCGCDSQRKYSCYNKDREEDKVCDGCTLFILMLIKQSLIDMIRYTRESNTLKSEMIILDFNFIWFI